MDAAVPLPILGAQNPGPILAVGDRQGTDLDAKSFRGELSRLSRRDQLQVAELGIGERFDCHS